MRRSSKILLLLISCYSSTNSIEYSCFIYYSSYLTFKLSGCKYKMYFCNIQVINLKIKNNKHSPFKCTRTGLRGRNMVWTVLKSTPPLAPPRSSRRGIAWRLTPPRSSRRGVAGRLPVLSLRGGELEWEDLLIILRRACIIKKRVIFASEKVW